MANRKNNARFQETEQRLMDAALELMEDAAPERITVRAVCERAQVNRSTFYAHFLDVPDMVDKMEARLHRKIMEGYPRAGEVVPLSPASFVPFLEHVRSYQAFYRVALPLRTSFPLKRGYAPLMEQVVRPACRRYGITDEEEVLCILVSFQAGFTNVLRRWVEGGCAQECAILARILAECVPAPLSPRAR